MTRCVGDFVLYIQKLDLLAGYKGKYYLIERVRYIVVSRFNREHAEVFANLIRNGEVEEYETFNIAKARKVKVFKNI